MSRLLIAGFGPFPQAPDNPAAATVRRLMAERWAPPDAQAAYAILPTTWAGAAETALHAARTERADGVLLIGVAVGAQVFRVEQQARNRAGAGAGRADADGLFWPSDVIDASGPSERRTSAPVHAMQDAIAAAGLPVTLSDNAGDYLCNFALYRMLAEQPMTAFLHIPPLGEHVGIEDLLTATRAAATAFTACLD